VWQHLLTSHKDSIQARAQREPAFRKALLQEGGECLLAGDVDTGKAVLRDHINATIGFEELSRDLDKSSKSLMRMFGPKGNPRASNLFAVIRYLQEQEGIHLEVKARKEGLGRCSVAAFNWQFFRAFGEIF
jgi:hypothetical protein